MYATSGRSITSSTQVNPGVILGSDIASDTILDVNIGAHTSTKITARNIEHGLAASRPASPAVGDIYVSTDTKELNVCVVATAWQTYPAVLLNGSGTQGDVIFFDGTKWTKLAAGTSGQFLKTQGAGSNPVWAAGGVNQTLIPAANDPAVGAAFDFFSTSIPGGVLGTSKIVEFYIPIRGSTTNGGVASFTLTYGATTLNTGSLAGGSAQARGYIRGTLIGNGSTSAQIMQLEVRFYTGSSTLSVGDQIVAIGTAAEDSTASKTFKLTRNTNGTTAGQYNYDNGIIYGI